MADYGLLGGLAEGLKQGLLTYQDVKKSQEETALKNRMLKLQGFEKGIVETPDGGFDYSPEKKIELADERDFKKRKGLLDEVKAVSDLSDSGLVPVYNEKGLLSGAKSTGLISPKKQKEQIEFQKLLQEVYGPQGQFKGLPEENKKQIDTLSTKTAGKKAINNQIKAALTKLQDPNVSEDQKIVLGRSLLKTLNSSEGADAIGAEEAKRLGGLLEYKFGNFTQPGSFIGRDLGEFEKQVQLTSEALDSAIKSNEDEVEKLYGRQPKTQGLLQKKTVQHPMDNAAVQWAKQNPKDPRSAAILKANGL